MENKFFAYISKVLGFSREELPTYTVGGPDYATPRERLSLADLLGSTDTNLSIATVYRCVKVISEGVAQLPLRYLRKQGGCYREFTTSDLYPLLMWQPNPDVNALDFWSAAVAEMLLAGSAYIVQQYGADFRLETLILCSRGSVTYNRKAKNYTIKDEANGIAGTFGEDEVIHLRGAIGLDGKPVSVIAHAAMTLATAKAARREMLTRYSSGGEVRGIVGNDKSSVRGFGELQDKSLRNVAMDIDEKFRSGSRIVSVPGSIDFKQIQMTSADMQFLEGMKFTALEICKFFGVPPTFVFMDGSNYKRAEVANLAFLTNTLNPILRKIEIELTRKLLTPGQWETRRIEFDRRALNACDLTSKSRYYAQMVQIGAMSVNEVRQLENMPPVENGDRIFVSANLKPIDTELNESNDPTQTPEDEN